MYHDHAASDDLNLLSDSLRRLAPAATQLDRDRLMYLSGELHAQDRLAPRGAWRRCAASAFPALAAGLIGLIVGWQTARSGPALPGPALLGQPGEIAATPVVPSLPPSAAGNTAAHELAVADTHAADEQSLAAADVAPTGTGRDDSYLDQRSRALSRGIDQALSAGAHEPPGAELPPVHLLQLRAQAIQQSLGRHRG